MEKFTYIIRRTFETIALVLFLIVMTPIALIAKLFEKPEKVTAREYEEFLIEFLEGRLDTADLFDTPYSEIKDPELEDIRKRVLGLGHPLDEEGWSEFKILLEEVHALREKEEPNLVQPSS